MVTHVVSKLFRKYIYNKNYKFGFKQLQSDVIRLAPPDAEERKGINVLTQMKTNCNITNVLN